MQKISQKFSSFLKIIKNILLFTKQKLLFFSSIWSHRSMVAILPHQSARGTHFSLRSIWISLFLIVFFCTSVGLILTSTLAMTDRYQTNTLTYRNALLSELLTEYKQELEAFSLNSAPQNAYIQDQLASWRNLSNRNASPPIGGGSPKALENTPPFDLQTRALRDKESRIAEVADLSTIIKEDISSLKTNRATLKRLYQNIHENKRFTAALPLSWPLPLGWGEPLPSEEDHLVLSVLPGTPVLSTASGSIHALSRLATDPTAWSITIRHDYGIETRYIGVSNPTVQLGDTVSKQDVLGHSGKRLIYKVRIALKFVPPEPYTFIRY